MSTNSEVFPIDIVSDVACPWCYVGKKKLEKALSIVGNTINPEVRWRPFQLSPEIPEEGIDYKLHLTQKFGSLDRLDGAWKRLSEIGKDVGINFQFQNIPKATNTLALHALVAALPSLEEQQKLVERFFAANFEEALDLTDKEVVWKVTEPVYKDRNKFDAIYSDSNLKQEIQQEIQYYHQNGISGVPYFIIGGKYAVSGAQDTSVFVEVIETVIKERESENKGQ
ncbi:Dithiol-disulfide isomerase involved in polyketide biosynthesis [Leptospira biflexa serovar Patoc strain 'Patoc 1 (Ames)']|jgi:predicted DsbA family dithiol-disulfide isomerase|uniref:Putative polyketide biosynthesis associated protein n=1 Tax=Leptospira biflexa serovar Patoc (strain Patoc 1 / ATCC 23582 / Paris) TaxID=456481 RepID=B0SJ10_LEPBP|nr:DsbA family oxidoreductase [Leptospira biflexa]ABZ92819.1 Dithiol-disulfide isomerase involved in polyketide biosynthesis [Leptospira biflexa serovar Patoc strain 'Patoc 1 (Ames)']ABZ96427.1 Putative polyketide biosynthesis associated protein [Leptospira biflexa serovar Patoc strain 'Patoc 1 (Paris)']